MNKQDSLFDAKYNLEEAVKNKLAELHKLGFTKQQVCGAMWCRRGFFLGRFSGQRGWPIAMRGLAPPFAPPPLAAW
jgi:hypothetical protein